MGALIISQARPMRLGQIQPEKADGSSAGDLPLLRFVLQSVSNVTATPIDPSLYSEKKRPDLTLEEAYGLVKAFKRIMARAGTDSKSTKSRSIRDFSFSRRFPTRHVAAIHYAVDLRTGEVWDEASCEKLTSPSLKEVAKRNPQSYRPDG